MLEPGKILGPFKIERELGSGAMGTVFRAEYTETGQPIAIKVIAMGLSANDTALARFEREADILKQMRHPNIVRLFATGRYKKTPFFAMEYVEGESVDKILERRGRLPWQEVVGMGKQLCKALQHAHSKGIIHRDLKPSNLMVLADGTLKLTDFGIAKDTDVTALTGANCTVGTAAYMSPEQCKGERTLTNKSDLYSLGVVFYELLTGEKPFKKDSPVDMFLAHVQEPLERPSRQVLDIPPWLDTLVCQLMEKKPEHRPFDAGMVKKVLDEVEDKMAEQRSAGLDLATARKADRPALNADDADREAARALRSGTKRKRTRPKAFYEKSGFLWVSMPAFLIGLVAIVWWFMRPASPESFYQRVISAGDPETALTALNDYFAAYPDRSDANAREMRARLEDLASAKLDRQMHNRFRRLNPMSSDDPGEQLLQSALRYEDAGEVAEARKRWDELAAKFAGATTVDDQAWVWLAKKKLHTLDDQPNLEKKLRESLETPESTSRTDLEQRCALALRYELFGDAAEALDRWTKIREEFIKDLDGRPFVVLAATKAHLLKDIAPAGTERINAARLELIQSRLAEVDPLLKDPVPFNLRKARRICKDIADLYADRQQPELVALVKEAKQRLAKIPEPPKP